MRKVLLVVGVAAWVAAFVACVGDDPTSSGDDSSSSDGGSSDSSVDSNSNSDATTNADGSIITPDASVDAGFTPASLPGLSLWLQGDAITLTDGASVTSWPDKSSHHNDAIGENITFLRNSADFGGHSAVKFSGNFTSAYIVDNSDGSLRIGNDGFLIEIVERHPRITAFDSFYLFSKFWSGSNTPGIDVLESDDFVEDDAGFAQLGVNYGDSIFVESQNVLSSNQINRIVSRYSASAGNSDGGVLSLTFGGSPAATRTLRPPIPDLGATGVPVGLGAEYSPDASIPSGSSFYAGEIAEIIVIKGNVTDAQQNAIDDYLKSRYGI